MRVALTSAFYLFGFSVTLSAQTVTLNAVMNNASYALPGTPNEAIAQGSIFALFGANLAPERLWQVSQFPLRASTPAGTSAKVTVSGITVDALPIYTTPKQVGAILPSNCPVGEGTVTLTYNGQTSAPIRIRVARSTFGIFSSNQQGSGPAAAQNFNSASDQPLNSLDRAATPGQTMILWGTGLGPITAPDNGPPPVGDVPVNLTLWVGGRPALVLYKGRSGCCAGIDQIIFSVPEDVEGCYVPIAVETDGIISNFTSIAVARRNGQCLLSGWPRDAPRPSKIDHPRYGQILFVRATEHSYSDSTMVGFEAVFGRSGSPIDGSDYPPIGSCTVTSTRANDVSSDSPVEPLEAGDLNLSGPISGVFTPSAPGLYFEYGHLSSGFPSGTYTIDNGAGGRDVKSFNTSFTIDEPLLWLNRAEYYKVSVAREKGLKVAWSTPATDGMILINGSSSIRSTVPAVVSEFVCAAPVAAREFTVPAYVLRSLPTSSNYGYLAVMRLLTSSFTAEGLDVGFLGYLEGGYTQEFFYK